MQGPDMDLIKEIPGYKIIMKAVLKHQIQLLVEQLADTTDEESILLTASVSDGTLSHLGTESGKNFLDGHEEIKSQFLGFVLKSHHTVKKKSSEKHFASGPGRKSSTQQSIPLVFDTDSDDTFSEASIHTESQLQIMSEPVITSPRPVSLTRNSQATKSKATASNIKNRPRRSAEAKRSPFKSNIYVDEDINLEENNDEDNSDNATITKHETDETKPDIKYTQTVSAILPLVSDLDTGNHGLGENSEESAAIESGLDDTVVVKMEAVSDHEGGNVDTDDPDWEPGAKKRRKSSGSRSLASPRDTSLNQSGQSGDSKYECSACGKTFVSETNLKRHRQVHQEPQVCHCGATFSTKEALKEHENAKHKRLYVCKECPVWRQFFSRSGLFSHCILAHKTNSTLKCEICGRRFGQLGHLKDHMNVHSDQANCVCDSCGTKFKYSYSLRKHLKVCTGTVVRRGRPRTRGMATRSSADGAPTSDTPNPQPVTCHKCGKGFADQRYLRQHLQKHVFDMRLCPTCGKSFKFKSSLCRHIKSCSKKDSMSDSSVPHLEENIQTLEESVQSIEENVQTVDASVLSGLTATSLSGLSEAINVLTAAAGSSVDSHVISVQSAVENVLGSLSESVTVLTSPYIQSSPSESVTVLTSPAVVTTGVDLVEYTAVLSEPSGME